jgi:hypothetical protein
MGSLGEALSFVRCDDAVRDAEAFGIAPTELPDLRGGAPDGAEALGALAQVGFVKAMRTGTISSSPAVRVRGRHGSWRENRSVCM